MIGAVERTVAEGEKAAADAGDHAAAAKGQIARIEKGETVSGGLGRPMTTEEIMAVAGLSPSEIRHCRRLAALGDFAGHTRALDISPDGPLSVKPSWHPCRVT
jgi:hypothetical protein